MYVFFFVRAPNWFTSLSDRPALAAAPFNVAILMLGFQVEKEPALAATPFTAANLLLGFKDRDGVREGVPWRCRRWRRRGRAKEEIIFFGSFSLVSSAPATVLLCGWCGAAAKPVSCALAFCVVFWLFFKNHKKDCGEVG